MRKKSLFYKKIFCAHCGGTFKSKNQKGRIIYLCSRYDSRKGGCKKRVSIFEDFLIEVINNRYLIKENEKKCVDVIGDKVEKIWVKEKLEFTIKLKDCSEKIIYSENYYIF